MSAEPAPGCDICSDHFERKPGIEDSVTKGYKDEAYAIGPWFTVGDYDDEPKQRIAQARTEETKIPFSLPTLRQ
jgi:hypothetical protein